MTDKAVNWNNATAEQCWQLLVEFYKENHPLYKKGFLSDADKPMFGLLPLVKTTDKIRFDSNFLDEIEEMLFDEHSLGTGRYGIGRDLDYYWFQYEFTFGNGTGVNKCEGKASTRDLARARCLCMVIDKVEGK